MLGLKLIHVRKRHHLCFILELLSLQPIPRFGTHSDMLSPYTYNSPCVRVTWNTQHHGYNKIYEIAWYANVAILT